MVSDEDVTNRTAFGSTGQRHDGTLQLYRFTLNAAGTAIARSAVLTGKSGEALDAADGR